MDVLNAAESGEEKALLIALRDAVATAIDDNPPARDLASLSRRLIEISRELKALEQEETEAQDDRITADEAFDPQAL